MENPPGSRHFYHGPNRDSKIEILALFPLPVRALSMGSLFCFINRVKSEESQSIKVLITYQVDVAAVTTTSTIRPTLGDAVFPPEADTSITTFAGNQLNFYPINKQFNIR